MEKKYLNPDTLLKPRGYTHIVTITGPAKMIFMRGLYRGHGRGAAYYRGTLLAPEIAAQVSG